MVYAYLLIASLYGSLLVYLTWTLWTRDSRIAELEADRERLIDRIRYLQDGPPRILPGPPDPHESPAPLQTSFFTRRKPEI